MELDFVTLKNNYDYLLQNQKDIEKGIKNLKPDIKNSLDNCFKKVEKLFEEKKSKNL